MKLYRYRPLNDFLFKELLYQELYYASYPELNDPLDLSAKIDFSPKRIEDVDSLLTFLFFTLYKTGINEAIIKEQNLTNSKLIELNDNQEIKDYLISKLYEDLQSVHSKKKSVSIEDLEQILSLNFKELYFKIDINIIKKKLLRQAKKFLQNSSAICFSETNNNFLMWSHYASKHLGICLEFTFVLPRIPYKYNSQSKIGENPQYDFTGWENKGIILTEPLHKVNYQSQGQKLNFFDFSFMFINERNISEDEITYELREVFSTKTNYWKYEKEWRSIKINFNENQLPEDRIINYPIQCLTGIYFGIRTPETVKARIFNILKSEGKNIVYYDMVLSKNNKLTTKKWELLPE